MSFNDYNNATVVVNWTGIQPVGGQIAFRIDAAPAPYTQLGTAVNTQRLNFLSMTEEATPEPSTFALTVCGLLGLLAYAWRKRK